MRSLRVGCWEWNLVRVVDAGGPVGPLQSSRVAVDACSAQSLEGVVKDIHCRTSTVEVRGGLAAFAIALIATVASAAPSESFPSKPIRIVTAQAGGGNDFAARLIAQGITASLGDPGLLHN